MVEAGSNHFSEEEMQLSEKLCVNCFIFNEKIEPVEGFHRPGNTESMDFNGFLKNRAEVVSH